MSIKYINKSIVTQQTNLKVDFYKLYLKEKLLRGIVSDRNWDIELPLEMEASLSTHFSSAPAAR